MEIALLMGGNSLEREVSLKSGRAVEQALLSRGYNVTAYDISKGTLPQWKKEPQVAFLALHGGRGENGELQAELESLEIPYTGSGPEACRIAMDKLLTKMHFKDAGLQTPPARFVSAYWPPSLIETLVYEDLEFPVVVKPCAEGSSIGVSIAKNKEELHQGLQEAFRVSKEILLEKYIPGREFTVAILEDSVLPLIELRPSREFFDFTAKYTDAGTQYIIQPELPSYVEKQIQNQAWKAHESLNCRHFSRVDVIWGKDGEIYFLEVNTIPGLTDKSLLPKAAKSVGISFDCLCEKMVQMAYRGKGLRKTA